jgi:imidazolonepropionase-like amidohydrolase
MFALEPATITIPADGTTQVTVTADTRVAGPDGQLTGQLTATVSEASGGGQADPAVVTALTDPARQQRYRNDAAEAYKLALQVALSNLKSVSDGGATISMGTDSGPPARFPGYFEHLELELMAASGMTPMQILLAATRDAARCLGLDDVGTLEAGKQADFVVLDADPLANVRNLRSIESVWIGGQPVAAPP